ncbi:MAG: AraC family transcriptional regulator [Bacteroidota bacterium]
MKERSTYQELNPSVELADYVHSYWTHQNLSGKPEVMKIFPDSFFKLVILFREGKILDFFMTGLWTESKGFTIPPKASTFGCRLRVLAPEYLLDQKIASLLNETRPLDSTFLSLDDWDLISDFEIIVKHWEEALLRIMPDQKVAKHKLRFSRLLYEMEGGISATEFAEKAQWSNRQISRYLNKYLGVSLKKYLNIQKCYKAYIQIREGRFFPEGAYFDQAHFVREIKKHTGETPRELYKRQHDLFIQLKNIKEK